MRVGANDAKLVAFWRVAYFSLAVTECWALGGAGLLGLVIGSGLPGFPSDPVSKEHSTQGIQPWHPDLTAIGAALVLLTLAVPGAIGFIAMLKPDFRRRAGVVWVSGLLMVAVAAFCVTAVANGWHL